MIAIEVNEQMKKLVEEVKEADKTRGYDARKKEYREYEATKDRCQKAINALVIEQAVEGMKVVGYEFDDLGLYTDEKSKFYLRIVPHAYIDWSEFKPSFGITGSSSRNNSIVVSSESDSEMKINIEEARAKHIERNRVSAVDDKNQKEMCEALGVKIDEYGYTDLPLKYELKNREAKTWFDKDGQIEINFNGEKIDLRCEANIQTKSVEEAKQFVKEFQEFLASRYNMVVRK